MQATTYDSINIMLPTYKRPERLRKCVTSAIRTAHDRESLKFTFCVNEKDDMSLAEIGKLFAEYEYIPMAHVTESTKQPNLSLYYNMMYDEGPFKDPGTMISMIGDDMVFRTQGWDKKVLDTANETDGGCVIHCEDAYIAHETMCVNLFTTRKMVEAQKKPFMCEQFHAEMIDVVWFYVGHITGTIRYFADVVIYHEHNMQLQPEDRDETNKRLAPIQAMTNRDDGHRAYAKFYATWCAGNIIEKGIGAWNTL